MKTFKSKDTKSRRGQSVIEFALVSVVFIFLLAFTFNVAIAFSVHQYLSYVAFMGARAYQASQDNPARQKQAAEVTLRAYLPGWNPGSDSVPLTFETIGLTVATIKSVYVPELSSIPQGAATPANPASRIRIEFEVSLLPSGFFRALAPLKMLSLEAESGLGRDVTKAECRQFFDNFFNKTTAHIPEASRVPNVGGASGSLAQYMEDTGC